MTTTPTEDSWVRQLLLDNLFAIFGEHDPERRMKAIVANYTEHPKKPLVVVAVLAQFSARSPLPARGPVTSGASTGTVSPRYRARSSRCQVATGAKVSSINRDYTKERSQQVADYVQVGPLVEPDWLAAHLLVSGARRGGAKGLARS